MNEYGYLLVEWCIEDYENTGYPVICDGDYMCAYNGVSEDV